MTNAPKVIKRRSFQALLAGGCMAAALPARAADWPSQPIRFIVPFPPGGSSDNVLRIVLDRLPAHLNGVPMVLDNKPGASTQLGTELAARAAPDGYTLIMGSSTAFTVLPHLRRKLPFDPATDFAPIGSIAEYLGIGAVRQDLGPKSLDEFIKLAKAHPGKFTFGSPGVGTLGHLQGEIIQRQAGIQLVHVPFKGSADAVTALAGGQIDFVIDGSVVPFAKSGRVKALFTFGSKRRPELPDVPAMTELGYDIERPTGPTWGLFAPVKTPPAVVRALADALQKVMAEPQTRERLSAIGTTPYWLGPEDLSRAFAKDRAFFGRLLPSIGIQPED